MTEVLPGLESWEPGPFREQLTRGGYHSHALESLGMPEKWLRSLVPGAAMLGRVQPGSTIDTLIRLFTLGETVSGRLAMSALGTSGTGLLELGLLSALDGKVFSRFQLIPIGDGWVACDFQYPRPELGEEGVIADFYVMGIGPSSLLVANLVPPLASCRVLEMGCGLAWLSSGLMRDGHTVTGVDLNPRALRLAEFQLKLRGLPPLDLRQGDGFDPVRGEEFDLIVSNPPYVQSPGGNRVYREGKAGESICERLLRDLPAHLAPGGIAVVLVNWMHAEMDSPFDEGPLDWLPEEGLRRWVYQTTCSTPADYAWMWIGPDPAFKGEAAVKEMRRWLDYYRDNGVGAISNGFVVVQRCEEGEEWTRTDARAFSDLKAGAGAEVLRILANQTWLESAEDDAGLLTRIYDVPDGLVAKAEMDLSEDGWTRQTIRLTSPYFLAYDGQIDENLMRMLELCKAGDAPIKMVHELRATPEFADVPELEETAVHLVRELISFGLLIPR